MRVFEGSHCIEDCLVEQLTRWHCYTMVYITWDLLILYTVECCQQINIMFDAFKQVMFYFDVLQLQLVSVQYVWRLKSIYI